MPSIQDGDGLDVTLCLLHCLPNADFKLLFPRDLGFLTELVGGPQTTLDKHQDRSRFGQWKGVNPAKKSEDHEENQSYEKYELKDYLFSKVRKSRVM